jgi:hypothetical protein
MTPGQAWWTEYLAKMAEIRKISGEVWVGARSDSEFVQAVEDAERKRLNAEAEKKAGENGSLNNSTQSQ